MKNNSVDLEAGHRQLDMATSIEGASVNVASEAITGRIFLSPSTQCVERNLNEIEEKIKQNFVTLRSMLKILLEILY